MEPVSLAVGVVGLYNASIGLLKLVHGYKEFETESSTTIARFNASKLRLQYWAETLGIRNGKLLDPHDSRLDNPQTALVVQDILRSLYKLFDKVEYKSASLKLPARKRPAGIGRFSVRLSDAENEAEQRQAISKKGRIAWVTGGKFTLSKDIQNFEGLVNILYDVVGPHQLEAASRTELARLEEKLDILANFDIGLETLLEAANTQKQHDIDAWLDAIKDDDQYEKYITLRLDGTCDWILGHPAYNWESQKSEEAVAQLLWIHGPAGFGKTVLASWLICRTKEISEGPLAYCFSSSHAQTVSELDGIVRTWVTQLIRKDNTLLDLAYQMRQRQNTRRASREDVWTLLKDIMMQVIDCVLVLDGLDEFQGVDNSRANFIRDLKKAVQFTRVRVLITSRNEFDIESELRSSNTRSQGYRILECIVSKDILKKDINLVSSSIVAKNLPGQESSLRRELATEMAERCEGQFLWLKLQQNQLRDSKSPRALKKTVQAMPQGLHSTYERSWNGIQALEEPDRSRAADILRWLTFAYRPLRVQELAEALVVNFDAGTEAFSEDELPKSIDNRYINGEIKNLCGSFIEVRDEKSHSDSRLQLVQLVHASVNEFLVTRLPVSPMLPMVSKGLRSNAAHHVYLAALCIRFLDCPKAWNPSETQDCCSFTAYAVDTWFRHLRDSSCYYDNISDLVNNFMRAGNNNFENWKKTYEGRGEFLTSTSGTALYYACLFGLLPAMDFVRGKGDSDINRVGGQFGTPLQAVCAEGYTAAFERLMLWKADVTVRGGQFGNALNAAAYYGRFDMLKAILENIPPEYPAGPDKHEAMRMAAGRGHVEVVELLLNQGTEVGHPGLSYPFRQQFGELESFATPLHAAANNGHLNVLKLLLERGAEPNTRNDVEDTALQLAAYNGHFSIVVQLIDKQADLEARNKFQLTPVHRATVNGHDDVVNLLIHRGASPNARDVNDWTPLHWAARDRQSMVVKALVNQGADVNIRSKRGWTPLSLAFKCGSMDIVTFLLQKGATLQSTDSSLTPLHIAVNNGSLDLVKLVIQIGADKNAQDSTGGTPLHYAAYQKRLDVVELLLEYKVRLKADVEGWTPLHLAAEKAQLTMTARLLEQGADINARTKNGRTPLYLAIRAEDEVNEQERLEEVRLLLEQGADFVTIDNNGWAPLHLAARDNHPQIVALFLDQGRDINAQTYDGLTALNIAISNGSHDSAELLVSRGADVNIANKSGFAPLHTAARKDNLEIARTLLKKKYNVNAKSADGTSPLRLAIENGTDELVDYLIQSGASLSAMDCYGMKCSDWLDRQRPHFRVPQSPTQIDDTPVGPDMTKLRHYVIKLATEMRVDEAKRNNQFYHLAHCFFLLGMEDDAKVAYQQKVLLEKDHSINVPSCNRCDMLENKVDPFYACKICPDTDLCKICMEKYYKEDLLTYCRDHDFIRIVASEAMFRPSDTKAFDQWLGGIVEQFKDP
ncbi:MAG: hypothetical protein Q9167_006739 [Letrouitia subvulpina]